MKTIMTSREDYLKAILVLSHQMPEVHAVDLAAYLGFSKASISRAVSLLEREGYLRVRDHSLLLSAKGREVAELTYAKYQYFSDWLISLGVEPKAAHEDACRMEHAVSDASFDKIRRSSSFRIPNAKSTGF